MSGATSPPSDEVMEESDEAGEEERNADITGLATEDTEDVACTGMEGLLARDNFRGVICRFRVLFEAVLRNLMTNFGTTMELRFNTVRLLAIFTFFVEILGERGSLLIGIGSGDWS